MQATDTLRKEHRAIGSVLDSLEKASQALRDGKQVPAWIFGEGLDFLRTFADQCHHGKEEKRLFPRFGERGVPTEGGPISVMLAEHEQGRGYIREAGKQYDKWAVGNASAAAPMTDALESYIALLRQHIFKENEILFPMGDRVISPEDDQWLVDQFEDIEEHEIGPGVHEKFHAMIDKLDQEAAAL